MGFMQLSNNSTMYLAGFVLLAFTFVPMESLAQDYLLRSVVDQVEGRVGQPLQWSVKFYWKDCCVRAPVYSDFDISDAEISGPSAPLQYQEEIEGIRFGVYELQYLVTPNKPGVLVIPAVTFFGEKIPSNSIFNPPANEVIDIEVRSDPISIQILE